MYLHYRFTHACGHTSIGASGFDKLSTVSSSPNNEKLTTVLFELPFSCPFCPNAKCSPTLDIADVALGHGVLAIISPTWPWKWWILRVCRYEDVSPQEWAQSTKDGGFRQMAWIPKPCGEVLVTSGTEEAHRGSLVTTGVITEVACAWKQGADETVRSRFAGLLSQLNAAILSGDNAGR